MELELYICEHLWYMIWYMHLIYAYTYMLHCGVCICVQRKGGFLVCFFSCTPFSRCKLWNTSKLLRKGSVKWLSQVAQAELLQLSLHWKWTTNSNNKGCVWFWIFLGFLSLVPILTASPLSLPSMLSMKLWCSLL